MAGWPLTFQKFVSRRSLFREVYLLVYHTTLIRIILCLNPSLNLERGYFSAVASGAAWLSGAAKPVVKALRKSLGEQRSSLKRYQSIKPCIVDSNFESE